jgi:geranylgeranyl pyrophosphate synthase
MGIVRSADGDYLSVCERKTGEAFALAAELGALAAGADGAPYRRYGLDFGIVFQIRDDIADGDASGTVGELLEKREKALADTCVARALGEWYRL